jgi:hypothetical protein
MDGLDKNVSLGEAIDIRAGDALTTQKVLARECAGLSGANLPGCELEVRNTARSIGTNAEIQALGSLSGMEAVIRSLAQVRERKTLVLVSAGLPVSDRAGMDLQLQPFMTSLGREAAAANLNFFVLHVDSGFLDAFSAEQRTISDTLDRDLSIMSGGLETIAGSSGGSLVRIFTGADFAFDRVLRETSAAYLLGVEPLEGDCDGKPHRISVKVRIPGAEVRSRREVLLPRAAVKAAAPATPKEALGAAFMATQPETSLPIRLATFNLAPDASGGQRVLVSADIGATATGPAEIWTAYATTDAAGRAQPGVAQKQLLRPRAAGPRGTLSFTARIVLPTGRHTLRFAAVDEAGRSGRVDHVFSVGLAKGDGILMGDLLVIEPLTGGEDRVDVVTDGIVRGDAVDAYIELVPETRGAAAPDVTFAVGETPEGDPIVSARGLVRRVEGAAHWAATARLGLATIAAGDYVVTATFVEGEREVGRAVRAIHIEPPARVARARAYRRAPALDAHHELMPALSRHAARRVAHDVALAELLEHLEERGTQALRRFDFEEAAAGLFGEILKELRLRSQTGRDGVHDHVGSLGHVEHGPGRQPTRCIQAVAEDDDEGAADIGLAEHHPGEARVDERGFALWRTPLSKISKSAARSPRTGFPFSVTSASTRTASTLDENTAFWPCATAAVASTSATQTATGPFTVWLRGDTARPVP